MKTARAFLIATAVLTAGCSTPPAADAPLADIPAGYMTEDALITTRDGAQISALIMRNRDMPGPLPALLQFTIYVRDTGRDLETLRKAVDHGYVGVFAYTRGKRFSPDAVVPYEFDGQDAHDVIDWISKQAWNDGRVGMYGGSYNGFTQWAAAKMRHPALKTIVPVVPNRPGMGLPMENNVFINPNYRWTFYVTNNKTLDHEVNSDRDRFRSMQDEWWQSGRAYRQLDRIDGQPNPWFQRWLEHPAYDDYWQRMAPYGQREFARIDMPILSIDGYYNDSSPSGLYTIRQHMQAAPDAEHYLIIGPYGHFGAQQGGQRELQGIEVDPAALFDIDRLTFEWFDYVFNGAVRPAILRDRVNYQVMGSNEWRAAASIEDMSGAYPKFFLSTDAMADSSAFRLSRTRPQRPGFHEQLVDFSDRDAWLNDYYPDPILKTAIDTTSGFVFRTEPLPAGMLYSGQFFAELDVEINKRDVDLGISLYEELPDGRFFQLSYYIGRASYSQDPTRRTLLTPGQITRVSFSNTRIVSKRLREGSRLVACVNVNKNPFSQLNYGSGKDVSDETVADAGDPLTVRWHSSSFIGVPLSFSRASVPAD